MANKKEYFYFIDTHSTGEKIAIVEKATNAVTRNGWTSDYKTIQTAGTNILKIRGIFTDTDVSINTLGGTFENIPARFHNGLVADVIASGYLDPRNDNIEKAQFFSKITINTTKEAKKFARSNYSTTGRIVPQDF